MQNKFLSHIGLCRKAGNLKCGTDSVREVIKSGDAKLVILASDISQNTKKELLDSLNFYNREYVIPGYTMDELSHATGNIKNISSVAITDENFKRLVLSSLEA